MAIYIWVAAMGIIGFIALSLFCYSLFRDLKLKKRLSYSFVKLLPNWLLMFIAIGAFSMTVYFFFNIKEQLLQFG